MAVARPASVEKPSARQSSGNSRGAPAACTTARSAAVAIRAGCAAVAAVEARKALRRADTGSGETAGVGQLYRRGGIALPPTARLTVKG